MESKMVTKKDWNNVDVIAMLLKLISTNINVLIFQIFDFKSESLQGNLLLR